MALLDRNTIILATDKTLRGVVRKIARKNAYYLTNKSCECENSKMFEIWAGLKALGCTGVLTDGEEQAVLGKLNIINLEC